MSKTNKKFLIVFSVIFYVVTAVLMIYGSFNDLQFSSLVFNPESQLAIIFECFGEAVAWIWWGPIFTVLLVTRHDLNESLEIIGRIVPAVHPVANVNKKAYKFFDFVLNVVTALGFFIGSVVGYKKIIENILKKFVDISQPVYFVICAVVAAAAFLLLRKADKLTLNKLEAVSLACLFMSVAIRLCMYLKPITNRVRFREMVAASNGIFNDEGLSHGTLDGLLPRTSRSMLDGTDFSAYTPWYRKGDGMGVYSHCDSFPSGHTLSATCAFLSVIVCNSYKKLQKAVPAAAVISAVFVYAMGYFRIVAGAHYLTDVAAGALIGYTLFLITVAVSQAFKNKKILPTRRLED